ncbi:MAG: ATP-binding cassette domain-containing protein, partial [Chloroflexota bacterium]
RLNLDQIENPGTFANNESSSEIAIHLSDVAITYHRQGLFDRLLGVEEPPATVSGINLDIKRGETVALVGESGSGKSTIVRTISGLLPAKSGAIQFENFDLTTDVDDRPMELRKRIQMIFQNPDASLNPRQSVSQIFDQPLKLYFPNMSSEEREKRKLNLLDRVRLPHKYLSRYPAQLSGGEKQRVAIARAFAAEPDVVLCDEVTSALDVSVQASVLELLDELQREEKVTYIFITHDLAVVRAFADRVAVLFQGRLCEVGTVEEIYSPPFHPYTQKLLSAVLEPDPDHRPVLIPEDEPLH